MSCRTSDGNLADIRPDSLSDEVMDVCREIRKHGGTAYIVGGSVRDLLLGSRPKDVDIEAYGILVDNLVNILTTLGKVELVGKQFGVFKLWRNGSEIDVALPRTERKTEKGHRGFDVTSDPFIKPEIASQRRDFTINAMMYDPLENQLFDFHGGRSDLINGRLKHVSPAFAEDPLRVLRGMQFAARFRLAMDAGTADLCRSLLGEAAALPSSRIWIEWQKWCHAPYPSCGLKVLEQTGWIDLYPELEAMIDCPQDNRWHPEGDVWVHTLQVVDQAAEIARRYGWSGDTREKLILGALCHDLGKPVCTFSDDHGVIRSPGHSHEGMADSERFLGKIAAPKKHVAAVLPLVREHMTHMHGDPTPRAVRHLAQRLEPTSIELWEALVEADASGRAPAPASRPALEWLKQARETESHTRKPEAIVSGKMLIELKISPGPEMGKILDMAYRAQLDGDFDDLPSAHKWLSAVLKRNGHPKQ